MSHTSATPVNRSRHAKKPGTAARSPNAWILYRSHKYREMETKRHLSVNPSSRTSKGPMQMDISRIIAAMWKNETPNVRERFNRLAAVRKAEHDRLCNSTSPTLPHDSSAGTAALWKVRLAGLDAERDDNVPISFTTHSSDASSATPEGRGLGSSSSQASHSRIRKQCRSDSVTLSASSIVSCLPAGSSLTDTGLSAASSAESAMQSKSQPTLSSFATHMKFRMRSLTETSIYEPPSRLRSTKLHRAATFSGTSQATDPQRGYHQSVATASTVNAGISSVEPDGPLPTLNSGPWPSEKVSWTSPELAAAFGMTSSRHPSVQAGPMSAPASYQPSFPFANSPTSTPRSPTLTCEEPSKCSASSWSDGTDSATWSTAGSLAGDAGGSGLSLDSSGFVQGSFEGVTFSDEAGFEPLSDLHFAMDPFTPQIPPPWNQAAEDASESLSGLPQVSPDELLSVNNDVRTDDALPPPHPRLLLGLFLISQAPQAYLEIPEMWRFDPMQQIPLPAATSLPAEVAQLSVNVLHNSDTSI